MKPDAALRAVQHLLQARHFEAQRLEKIADAMRPWTTQSAIKHVEVKGQHLDSHPLAGLARKSQTNVLPLVLDTFSQGMKVDNYFSGQGHTTAAPWEWWQRNRMDAAQTGIIRAALRDGVSYATVLPAMTPGPSAATASGAFIRGRSARQMTALYGEPLEWDPRTGGPVDPDWPIMALEIQGPMIRLYDEEKVHFIGTKTQPKTSLGWKDPTYTQINNFEYIEGRSHGVGVCPVVRFQDRMLLDDEDETWGIIEPLINPQDRLNETTWELMVAQYFTAFIQRYVSGWMPKSEQEALRQAASDIWFFDDKDVKVGSFPAGDLKGYLESRRAAIQDLSALGQVPPQNLGLDGISNISETALAALETGKERKSSEIETSLGESFEQMLRTCAHIVGDTTSAQDFASEVKWRDATARSFAQTVDGLGKLSTMLNVPDEVLWEAIPGWTREMVERARRIAAERDPLRGLFEDGTPPPPKPGEGNSVGDEAPSVKEQADALGVLVRAGADPDAAATYTGFEGLPFTGAIPVSLRPKVDDAAKLEDKG
ncbi:phage portal protein [Rhodococcus zopfii]|uniref:phage portal protein n=1 Tax=Rhodococcus zopfii TaxID=43772 RepID=UPI0035291B3A